MRFITLFAEAQLHREVYVAVLNGLLCTPGEKRAFARRVGISPVYLSYLLALDDGQGNYPTLRVPSERIARRIADNLAAPAEIRDSVFTHMLLTREKSLHAQHHAKEEARDASLPQAISELRWLQVQATHAKDPLAGQRNYRAVVIGGRALLTRAQSSDDVLEYLALCDILCDSECVLNQHAEALWHAKLACAILDQMDMHELRPIHMALDAHRFNMLRMQGVAYGNLGDYRSALRLFATAEQVDVIDTEPGWMILLQRDKINALARLPRYAIGEVEGFGRRALTLCDHPKTPLPDLLMLLVVQSLAEAHIRHHNFHRAQHLLQAYEHSHEQITAIGPLHKVLFLRTCANLCLATQDLAGWERCVRQAYQQAIQAGLSHQCREMEKGFKDLEREDLIATSPQRIDNNLD